MPVLLESDERNAASLGSCLPDGAHVVATREALDAWLLSRPDEYAVVVGTQTALHDAATLADRLRATHPSAGLVLVRSAVSTEIYESAMEAGIPAVVAESDPAALTSAVNRARMTWEAIHGPAGESRGKVFTVFSPKGGTGKTTLSVNLALALGHDPGVRVCVVDLDLGFGDIAITLQLIPEHTIVEAVGAESSLDFALLQRLLTRYADNVMVLAAPTTPDGKDRIAPALVRRIITTLRRQFDYLVIDTAPGFDEQVLQAFDETDELVVLATLDVPTIKNTKVALETLDLLDIVKGHRHLVLNRMDADVGLSPTDVESILRLPIVASLPSDVAVALATNNGKPIVAARPEHRVAREIGALAEHLAGGAVNTQQSRRGLFGRGRRAGATR